MLLRYQSNLTPGGNPVITTHYLRHPREHDPRWKNIDMTREAAEYSVVIVGKNLNICFHLRNINRRFIKL